MLGIISMMLPGSWMGALYIDLKTKRNPIHTMQTVKSVISDLQVFLDSMHVLLAKKDLFKNILPIK